MRKIFLSFLIVLLLFSSCSSDNPSPSGEDVNPPATSDESTLVQKTTEGKFIVETTLQSLSGKIQEAIKNNETEVDLVPGGVPVVLENDVTVIKGKILIEAPDSAARAADSSYSFSVIIEEAETADKESVTLEYESNIQLDAAGSITKIEPVKTEAKIGGASVSDIDSDTFIPVALAFFNEDLLNSLSQLMKDIAASEAFEKFGISLEQMTINTNIESIGKVDVDCAKSALLSNGAGVLVFKLVDLDNQWHTASSAGGVITIDGWADVVNSEIQVSDAPAFKDEESDITAEDELDIVNSFAPRFYSLYMAGAGMLFDYENIKEEYVAIEENLPYLSFMASVYFKENIEVTSFSITADENFQKLQKGESLLDGEYGVLTAYASLSEYGSVVMTVHSYDMTNDIVDSRIAGFSVGNNDYSYLGSDILKSLLRVFTGTTYVMDGLDYIQHDTADIKNGPEEGQYFYDYEDWYSDPLYTTQQSFSGKVSLTVTDRNDEGQISGTYSFNDIKVNDDGDVEYSIEGNGRFIAVPNEDKTPTSDDPYPADVDMIKFTVDYYFIKGIGTANAYEQEIINLHLDPSIYTELQGSIDF